MHKPMAMGKRKAESHSVAAPDAAHAMRYSKVDAETSTYFAEIFAHFKTLNDEEEERQLVADNALGEAAGREPKVASDAACSRVIEALLPHASIPALAAFVEACVEGESLGATCTSGPFGSHVLEKALQVLAEWAARADEDGYAIIEQVLTKATDAISDNLYDMAVHKYATHVARRLLSVLCGRDVAPAQRKQQQQRAAAAVERVGEGGGEQAAKPSRGAGASPGGLKAKVGMAAEGSTAGAAGADYPHLLERVFSTVLSDDWAEAIGELQKDTFGSPLLQALLRAAALAGNEATHQKLLLRMLGASSLDGLSVDTLHTLMKDKAGSHLMEVAFETAPDDLYQRLSTSCFKGHLLDLARHPSANFAVQAGIAALRKPAQLKRVFEDLRPHLASLLRSRRGGVIAAVAGAAGRLGAQEADVAGALWHALGAGGDAAGAAGTSPLAALLMLDTNVTLGDGGRLSPLGCALAATLLRYPPVACKQFAEAVAALPPGQLAAVARDSGGCRVLEAYLEGAGAAPKKRRHVIQNLAGAWAAIASQPAGSYFVEKCYTLADMKDKETIAGELAAAEQRLAATYRGLALLRRCGVEALKKGSEAWQQRAAAADAVRREFEELFADEGGQPGGPGGGGGSGVAGGDVEGEWAAGEAGSGEGAKGKKRRRKEKKDGGGIGEVAREVTAAAGGEMQAPLAKKKKGSKKAAGGEGAEGVAEAGAEAEVPPAKKKKKGSKKAAADDGTRPVRKSKKKERCSSGVEAQ